jgi:hypothetical protein
MRFMTTGMLFAAMALAVSAAAQTPPAPTATARKVLAAAKLPTVTDVPLHFGVLSVTIPPGEKSVLSGANGVLYQVSGFTEVSFGSDTKLLNAGEGLFIAGGAKADLKAGGPAPSTFLHFFLAPAAELDRPATKAPAAEREFYRTAAAIPGLKPGGYDINRTQVTFPAGMPSNPLTIGQERPCTSSSRAWGPTRSAARPSRRDRAP